MSITAVVMKILRTNNMFNKIAEMFIKYCKHVSYHKEFPIIFYPDGIYLFKVNIGNTKTTSKICSKLKIKTPEQRQ